MELKEARYILAIYNHRSISKAAEELYISQPSLSKYLKNLEQQLGAKLFDRVNNNYLPTFIGERYIHYAKRIVAYGDEWSSEFADITNHNEGRLNIAIPIMLGPALIHPTLSSFYQLYPNVKINLMEEVHFVAEHTLEDHSVDLIFYNVHDFPDKLSYEILDQEEIVMIVSKKNPLSKLGEAKPDFRHPWVDMTHFKNEKFIMLYPDQTTGSIALRLFDSYHITPNVLLSTRNSEMAIRLAMDGIGIAFAPESYYRAMKRSDDSVCFSIGKKKMQTTLIAAFMKHRYMPQYAREYIAIISSYCKQRQKTISGAVNMDKRVLDDLKQTQGLFSSNLFLSPK